VRFSWQTTGSALVLHIHEYVSGRWNLDDGTVTRQQMDRHAHDEHISLGYQITAGTNAGGDPASMLRLDQHVIRGVNSNRFAFERELAAGERAAAKYPAG